MWNRWRTRTRWAVSPKSKILQLLIRRPHAGHSQETLEEGVISIMPIRMWRWDEGQLRESSVWRLSQGFLTLLRALSPAVTWESVSSISCHLAAFCLLRFCTGFAFRSSSASLVLWLCLLYQLHNSSNLNFRHVQNDSSQIYTAKLVK